MIGSPRYGPPQHRCLSVPGFLQVGNGKRLYGNGFSVSVEAMNTASPISVTNNPVRIAPGLTLDSALYEAAAAGVAEHLPDLRPLQWEDFVSRQWTLVPDELTGEPYKAELTVSKTSGWTVKTNLWLAPD